MLRLLIAALSGFALAFVAFWVGVLPRTVAETEPQPSGATLAFSDGSDELRVSGREGLSEQTKSPFRSASFSSMVASASPTLVSANAVLGSIPLDVKDKLDTQKTVLFLVRVGENARLTLVFDSKAEGLKAVTNPPTAEQATVNFSQEGKQVDILLREGCTEISLGAEQKYSVSLALLTGPARAEVVNSAWMLQTKVLEGDSPNAVSNEKILLNSPLKSTLTGVLQGVGQIMFESKPAESSSYGIKQESLPKLRTGRVEMRLTGIDPNVVVTAEGPNVSPELNLGTLLVRTKTATSEFAPQIIAVSQTLDTAKLLTTQRTTEWLYDAATGSQRPLLLAGSGLTIAAKSGKTNRTLQARVDGVPTGTATTDGSFKLDLSTVGEQVIDVVDTWTAGEAASQPVLVKVPSNQLDRPQILFYRQGSGAEVKAATAGITAVGKELTLIGRTTPGTQIQLILLEPPIAAAGSSQPPEKFEQRSNAVSVPVQASGMWEQAIELPTTSRETRVIAVAASAATHQLSIAVPVVRAEGDATAVQLGEVKVKYTAAIGSTGPGVQTDRDAAGKLVGASSAKLTFSNCVGLANGDVVRVRRGGDELAVSSGRNLNGNSSFDITVEGLKPDMNRLMVSIERGSSRSAEKEVEIVSVTQGPYVEAVEPLNFGLAPGVTSLRLKFAANSPLEKSSAEEKRNYVLVSNRGKGKAVPPEEARLLGPREVLLEFRKSDGSTSIAADEYELRINANPSNPSAIFGIPADSKLKGLRDELGLRLDSNGLEGGGEGEDVSVHLGDASGGSGSPAGGVNAGLPLRQQLALPLVTAEQPDLLTQRVGLPDTTGRPVDYPEFTNPRPATEGFNPSDKVVTRVARLYFFRDGHRVAQIINRRAKSHNAQSATMARQLADKARLFAEQTTDRRRAAERQAVDSAAYSREAENRLARYQSELVEASAAASQGRADVESLQVQIKPLEAEAANAASIPPGKYAGDTRTPQERLKAARQELAEKQELLSQSEQKVATLTDYSKATLSALEALRERELQQRETMNREQAADDRAADHQFRLELQAATTDPDTYVEGNPAGLDPVAQVTISVIGEGLLQLRGPSKGVNIVQSMINEIDAPTGQVRVGIHTVQINGENGQDMEQVAARIQRYTDHSRFLTSQSGQMLRNAVAFVASRKAQEFGYLGQMHHDGAVVSPVPAVPGSCPPETQDFRRYQDAFFGAEFMQQLRQMDSELTRPGNKLLSLNSMDTTSLASSLFLTALASNETRREILHVFQQQTMVKLPADEFEYFNASNTQKWYHFRKFTLLAENARFVSLRGYLDGEIAGDQTLNPVQREFIKLAQILKSRLVNEVELKQRVIERALIEERVGSNYRKQQQDAVRFEQLANEEAKAQQTLLQQNITNVLQVAVSLSGAKSLEESTLLKANEAAFRRVTPTVSLASGIVSEQNPDNDPGQADGLSQLLGVGADAKFDSEAEVEATKVIAMSGETPWTGLDNGDSEGFYKLMFSNAERLQRIGIAATDNETVKQELRKFLGGDGVCFVNVTFGDGRKIGIEVRRNKKDEKSYSYENRYENTENIDAYIDWLADRAAEVQRDPLTAGAKVFLDDFNTKLAAARDVNGSPLDPLFSLLLCISKAKNERLGVIRGIYDERNQVVQEIVKLLREAATASLSGDARTVSGKIETAYAKWSVAKSKFADEPTVKGSEVERRSTSELIVMDEAINSLLTSDIQYQFAVASAEAARRPLDHKKFLDMLIDEAEEKQIQLLEGTRAHTAVIDDYVKRICTALEDDFNTQFYEPAFRRIREETYHCGTVSLGQIEHTSVLTGNRQFAKVQPQATMEFDLPKRRIMIAEAMAAAQAGMSDYGALLGDPNFLALTKLYSGQPTSSTFSGGAAGSQVRDVLPGLPSQTGESAVIQAQSGQPQFQSQLESLVPDPAIYKFETGTGYEVRPVIQPDGQSVLFDLNYMYTTNVREPVAADEKHLGRVKRHFIDTDVQVGNYELREVSRYRVALKAERSGRGVPLLESIPGAGALFRPVNDGESSLQQNIILAHSVIYPTLFDLMGLRWAPAVADLDEEDIKLQEFTYRNRMRSLKNEVYDYSSSQVDEFLRIPQSERRPDLYRSQVPIPAMHPNGYSGPGNGQYDSILQEGDGMSLPEESIPAEGAVDGSSVDEFPNQSSVVPPGGWGRLRAETAGVRTAKGEASGASAGNSGRVRLEDSRGKPSTARSDARVRPVSRSEQPVRKDGITSRLKSLATGKSSYSP